MEESLSQASMWRVVGCSVQGSAHARKNLPNQDAIRWFPEFGAGSSLILSVADGHGDALSFRSSIGSCLAVLAAQTALTPFISNLSQLSDEQIREHGSQIKSETETNLPAEIVRRWKHLVQQHWLAAPISHTETDWLAQYPQKAKRLRETQEFYSVYGATIMTVLATPHFIIYAQLGDGDVLALSAEGLPYSPLPTDDRLFANEPPSLCLADASLTMRVKFQSIQPPLSPPSMLILSTDGFKNSFESEADYLSFGTDIYQRLTTGKPEEELNTIAQNLTPWLAEISRGGSGDDVSLGILFRMNAFQSALEDTQG